MRVGSNAFAMEKDTRQVVSIEVDRDFAIAAKRKIESSIYSKLNIHNHISIDGFDCDSTVFLKIRFLASDEVRRKVERFVNECFELTD